MSVQTLDNLKFADKEAVLLYNDQPGKERFWYGGAEAFYQASVSDDSVEFSRLTDDSEMFIESAKPQETYVEPQTRLMGTINHIKSVLFENQDEWQVYSFVLPTPSVINAFQAQHLQPLGSHNLPLQTMDGDAKDDLFKATTMAQTIADGVIPIGTEARLYLHDMQDHSLGLSIIEATTMHTLQQLFKFGLQREKYNPQVAQKISIYIAHALDVATFSGYDECDQLSTNRRDPLFSWLMKYCATLPRSDRTDMVTILQQNGFAVRGNNVLRPIQVAQYYKEVEALSVAADTNNELLSDA